MKLIFEKSKKGAGRLNVADFSGSTLPSPFVPKDLRREEPIPLPEVSEVELVRHYLKLSQENYGVDSGFYPLGSCTMKYNPKINEEVASIREFTELHPLQPEFTTQGALRLMWELAQYLKEISGMDEVSLQPAAGAQGELTGMLVSQAYFREKGEERPIMLVPDSAHGTNPASASVSGFKVKEVKSDNRGLVTVQAIREVVESLGEDKIAGIMLTNPNTLGIFEKEISAVSKYLHGIGALLYYDGANLNPLLAYARPADMGFDIVHFNLHKTFSTPHGGGGPGAGPIGVTKSLAPFLPSPILRKGENGKFEFFSPEKSIGRMKFFYGNFLILVRAYAYIRTLGAAGLKRVAENAVLNANYIQERLKEAYVIPYYQRCMHEFVLSCKKYKVNYGITARDIAKKLLDNGVHAPTIYFPLIVEEAMMIEPTETESKERLDEFCELMLSFSKAIETDPEEFRKIRNLKSYGFDEVDAARNPVVKWSPEEDN